MSMCGPDHMWYTKWEWYLAYRRIWRLVSLTMFFGLEPLTADSLCQYFITWNVTIFRGQNIRKLTKGSVLLWDFYPRYGEKHRDNGWYYNFHGWITNQFEIIALTSVFVYPIHFCNYLFPSLKGQFTHKIKNTYFFLLHLVLFISLNCFGVRCLVWRYQP